MTHVTALPFSLKRGTEAISAVTVTTTRETIHGLLQLRDGQLTVQWRLARKTEHVGWAVHTDREIEPVREITVPISRIAGATVRGGRWAWFRTPRLVLTAADLTALQELVGSDGLGLDHPAELVVDIRRIDRLAAEEFCAELALAIASLGEGQPGGAALPTPAQNAISPASSKRLPVQD